MTRETEEAFNFTQNRTFLHLLFSTFCVDLSPGDSVAVLKSPRSQGPGLGTEKSKCFPFLQCIPPMYLHGPDTINSPGPHMNGRLSLADDMSVFTSSSSRRLVSGFFRLSFASFLRRARTSGRISSIGPGGKVRRLRIGRTVREEVQRGIPAPARQIRRHLRAAGSHAHKKLQRSVRVQSPRLVDRDGCGIVGHHCTVAVQLVATSHGSEEGRRGCRGSQGFGHREPEGTVIAALPFVHGIVVRAPEHNPRRILAQDRADAEHIWRARRGIRVDEALGSEDVRENRLPHALVVVGRRPHKLRSSSRKALEDLAQKDVVQALDIVDRHPSHTEKDRNDAPRAGAADHVEELMELLARPLHQLLQLHYRDDPSSAAAVKSQNPNAFLLGEPLSRFPAFVSHCRLQDSREGARVPRQRARPRELARPISLAVQQAVRQSFALQHNIKQKMGDRDLSVFNVLDFVRRPQDALYHGVDRGLEHGHKINDGGIPLDQMRADRTSIDARAPVKQGLEATLHDEFVQFILGHQLLRGLDGDGDALPVDPPEHGSLCRLRDRAQLRHLFPSCFVHLIADDRAQAGADVAGPLGDALQQTVEGVQAERRRHLSKLLGLRTGGAAWDGGERILGARHDNLIRTNLLELELKVVRSRWKRGAGVPRMRSDGRGIASRSRSRLLGLRGCLRGGVGIQEA
eukprot:scaffold1376_cov257-Pinguiococcus_pyrenoidosus.AAC.28